MGSIRHKLFASAFVAVVMVGFAAVPAIAATKVTLNPTSATLSEGNSQTITVTLDQPIISPGPDPAYLHLNLTSSDPSRVTLSTSTVNYTTSDWAQPKTFSVTAMHDGVHNSNNTITVSFLVDSNSEFYNNYAGNLVVTIADIDPAPVADTNSSSALPASTLAETGDDMRQIQLLSGLVTLLILTTAIWAFKKSRSTS